jgi:propionate CoA-transferase
MTYTEILFEPDAAGFVQVTINRPQKLNALSNRVMFVPAVRQITFSGAHAVSTGQEVLYVTEAAVFRLTAEGLQLEEVAPGLDPERDVIAKMAFRPMIGASVGTMRAELFAPAMLPADCFPAFQ